MGKVLSLLLFSVAVIASSTGFAADPGRFANASPNAHPQRFVGTYFVRPVDTPFPPAPSVMTLHADGTLTAVGAEMFIDEASNTVNRTPSQGVWKMIDENEVEATAILFSAGIGTLFSQTGIIAEVVSHITFDDPLPGNPGRFPGFVTAAAQARIFLGGQDPTVDEPVAVVPLAGVVAHRLEPAGVYPTLP